MINAYTSLNKAIQAAWLAIAPAVPIRFDGPNEAVPLPPECLRVFWETDGEPTRINGQYEATIDMALFVPPVGETSNRKVAIARGTAIDTALGLLGTGQMGRLARWDYTVTPALYLNDMEILDADAGWVYIPTDSPGQLHRARTIILRYRLRP